MAELHFSASVQDELSVRASTDVYSDPANSTTLASLLANFDAWLTTLDTVSAGAIVAAKIEIKPSLPTTLKASPVSGSRTTQTGEVRFNLTGTQARYSTSWPALANSMISNGKLDLTAISAYTSLLLGAASYTSPDGIALASVFGGFVGDRSHRKQQQRGTFATP